MITMSCDGGTKQFNSIKLHAFILDICVEVVENSYQQADNFLPG